MWFRLRTLRHSICPLDLLFGFLQLLVFLVYSDGIVLTFCVKKK
jgi:hypothetical protein